MKRIQVIVDEMDEEIESAKKYIEDALTFKVKGQKSYYEKFKEMANDEMKHANYLHEYAVEQINELSSVYTPPEEMVEKWKHEHKKYIEDVAQLKVMLTM